MILRINDLQIECILGDLPDERRIPQLISVSVELELGDDAGTGDRLDSTVDYVSLAKRLSSALRAAKCHLLESAAKLIAEECLDIPLIKKARCTVRKTGRIKGIGSAEAVYECG